MYQNRQYFVGHIQRTFDFLFLDADDETIGKISSHDQIPSKQWGVLNKKGANTEGLIKSVNSSEMLSDQEFVIGAKYGVDNSGRTIWIQFKIAELPNDLDTPLERFDPLLASQKLSEIESVDVKKFADACNMTERVQTLPDYPSGQKGDRRNQTIDVSAGQIDGEV